MPYCVHCGAENQEGAKFCASCGKLVTVADAAPASQPQDLFKQAQAVVGGGGSAKMLLLAGMGLYVAAAVLTILGGNVIGLLISAGMVALLYFLAYVPFTKGEKVKAANGTMIAAVISLAFGFLDLILGDIPAAIFVFIIAAVLGIAWNSLRK